MIDARPAHNDEEDGGNVPYRISVKAARPDWRVRENCVVGISLGQEYHEGGKLESLLSWAGRRFPHVILNIGDALHRHNMACAAPEENLRKAVARGDDWLARNRARIDRHIGKKLTVCRWSQWLTDPAYPAIHAAMLSHYEESPLFRMAVAADTAKFTARQQASDALFVRKKSREYLLEEAAAYTVTARQYRAARVYPAADLHTLSYLSREGLPGDIRGLEYACQVQVKFHRRPSWRETPENQAVA